MVKVNSGPHKSLFFKAHEDAEAYDKEAGKIGACVETADLSDVYRSLLPEAHGKFAAILARNTAGITRGIDEKATTALKERSKKPDEIEGIPEKYIKFANRVKVALEATDAGKTEWKSLDAEIHSLAASMFCDSSPTAKRGGPSKNSLTKAQEILSRDDAGYGSAVEKLQAVVENYPLEVDEETGRATPESLGGLIDAWANASL